VNDRAQITPRDLLDEAVDLLVRPDPVTAGLWPRAAALLARQALELGIEDVWKVRAPGIELCSTRAQLLCLETFLRDSELATNASHAWWALTQACHHRAYELAPTASELSNWIEVIRKLLATSSALKAADAGY
jgi:hypothetical protein